ncbi:MAG: sigma 54-interacting transcriptional regulator, partial [Acidobacteria bacterium]|nr:sigma 54-interacting transcriptional regulator [Acidobacteriota bacterium]
LRLERLYLQEELDAQHNFGKILGRSGAMKRIFQDAESVARTDSTVLITGETGTGKELIARALHHASDRQDKVMVKVNCAALPSGLIESELFGHEKGAFTGAISRKIGRFELAHRGTIFLDEIGDLSLELQTKLLRVLQDGEFERLGSSQTLRVDVRVIAATNQDLEKAIEAGRFRADLFYRLNVFPIPVPPLRKRKEDIQLLAEHFVARYSRKLGKKIERIPRTAMDALLSYSWPGNIRELENVIERAMILSREEELELGDWFARTSGEREPAQGGPSQRSGQGQDHGRRDLRGIQGHGQHGGDPGAQTGGQARVPGHRYQPFGHAQGRIAAGQG